MNILKTLTIVLLFLTACNNDCSESIDAINDKYDRYVEIAIENGDDTQRDLLERERTIKLRDACD